MPFKSEAQRRFLHAKHPKIAKKWEEHTPKGQKLPQKAHNDDEANESFEIKLNDALGLVNEAECTDPQATTRPRLGAIKGVLKGPKRRQVRNSNKEEKIQKDIKSAGG